MCEQMFSYILGIVKNLLTSVSVLKVISDKKRAYFNFASQTGSQHLYL